MKPYHKLSSPPSTYRSAHRVARHRAPSDKTPAKQAGVALLVVLMIVALVSVLATEMGSRLQLNVQRVINIKDNNQAYWYAIGTEAFARKSIATFMRENDDVVNLNQGWSEPLQYPVEGGVIEAELEDLQSCFNLNGLLQSQIGSTNNANDTDNVQAGNTENTGAENNAQADSNANSNNTNEQNQANLNTRSVGQLNLERDETEAMRAFLRLLELVDLEIDSYTAETVRDSLADWLDDDDRMRTYGAEDSTYMGLQFPYLAANNLLSAQSELRLVNGVSPLWLNQLLPYICVIPNFDLLALNVNTLTQERAPVLAALTGLELSQAEGLIAARPEDGWQTINDFFAEPDLQAVNLTDMQRSWFQVTSEYFLLHTKTRYNEATFTLTSLFAVNGDKVNLVRREFGGVK